MTIVAKKKKKMTEKQFLQLTELPVRCFNCRKAPKNCQCARYRAKSSKYSGKGFIFVDNIARMPVRGENTGIWQPRRNAKFSRRPVYEDGFGPVILTDTYMRAKVLAELLNNDKLSIDDLDEFEGIIRVRNFERAERLQFGFLKRRRTRK